MVPTAGQLMHRFKAQPIFPIRLPEARLAGQQGQEVRSGSPSLPSPAPAPLHPPCSAAR